MLNINKYPNSEGFFKIKFNKPKLCQVYFLISYAEKIIGKKDS